MPSNLVIPFYSEAPFVEQYLGVWAIRETEFLGHVEWAKSLDLHVHLNSPQAAMARGRGGDDMEATVQDGVAVIPLRGTLMKQVSSMSNGTSTVLARRLVRSMANNDDVKAIVLHVDSPGGTVAGTKELADDVAEAAKRKPVYAYIDDLGASAAYWISSQATKVFANETALVGSIGTYGVVHDMSGLAAREGVKVHVVRAGAFKGMGTPGTEVTAEQLQDLQRIVNEQNEFFLKGVAKGRNLSLSQVREIADGRIHVGKAAQSMSLIDGVSTLDAVFAQAAKTKPIKGSKAMSDTIEAPKSATLKELRAACPGADEKFLCSQLDAEATVATAQGAWMVELSNRNKTLTEELAKKPAPAPTPAPTAGVDPLPAGGKPAPAASGDAIEAFEEAVAAEVAKGKSRHDAHQKVCREQPDLRDAMVAAHNTKYAKVRPARKIA